MGRILTGNGNHLRLAHDATSYNGGHTLSGGSHFDVLGKDGTVSLDFRLGNEDGGAGYNVALEAEDAVELATALTLGAEAVRNWLMDRRHAGDA